MALWLVTGIPGSGKSTTARALARSVGRGVHIEGDLLQRMIVSGGVPPRPEADAESERQIGLNIRHQCMLARSFRAESFAVVIDYVVANRRRLDQYLGLLAPEQVALVVLCPSMETAEARDLARTTKRVLPAWRHLADEIRAELSGTGLWLDNTGLSVEETVRQIHAGSRTARISHQSSA
ncbi:AAA family ATPase [Micromonospora inyonensis]|uniref:Adenylylsulfate kinase n=1 Tax=Micromonospora inyonensis TaxID=47866 RepID=A0A1C6RLL3_9ACTN|nr:AAA family ATPase [Micromonospora inyonensis]SCL18050.1 Adenylylsulfate kinase [Micromonospora inyonensis]